MIPVYHPATEVIYSSKVGERVVKVIVKKDRIGLRRVVNCGRGLTVEDLLQRRVDYRGG